jgi:hypothetical protein
MVEAPVIGVHSLEVSHELRELRDLRDNASIYSFFRLFLDWLENAGFSGAATDFVPRRDNFDATSPPDAGGEGDTTCRK